MVTISKIKSCSVCGKGLRWKFIAIHNTDMSRIQGKYHLKCYRLKIIRSVLKNPVELELMKELINNETIGKLNDLLKSLNYLKKRGVKQ